MNPVALLEVCKSTLFLLGYGDSDIEHLYIVKHGEMRGVIALSLTRYRNFANVSEVLFIYHPKKKGIGRTFEISNESLEKLELTISVEEVK